MQFQLWSFLKPWNSNNSFSKVKITTKAWLSSPFSCTTFQKCPILKLETYCLTHLPNIFYAMHNLLRSLLIAILLQATLTLQAQTSATPQALPDNTYVCRRPQADKRAFTSESVEKIIDRVKQQLKAFPKLQAMFENCYPNTLDTTVRYSRLENGDDDTFIITGDCAGWCADYCSDNSVASASTPMPTLSTMGLQARNGLQTAPK